MYWLIIFLVGFLLIFIGMKLKKIKVNQYELLDNNSKIIINQLMIKSNLPQNICTDIFVILKQFQNGQRDTAYNTINTTLKADLITNNHISDVGVAFGMLIDSIALTQEEAIQYSTKIMNEMVNLNGIK